MYDYILTNCFLVSVEVQVNWASGEIKVTQLGANTTAIDNRDLKRGETVTMNPDSTLFILKGMYPHKIVFKGDNPPTRVKNGREKREAVATPEKRDKRKHDSNSSPSVDASDGEPSRKKPKVEKDTSVRSEDHRKVKEKNRRSEKVEKDESEVDPHVKKVERDDSEVDLQVKKVIEKLRLLKKIKVKDNDHPQPATSSSSSPALSGKEKSKAAASPSLSPSVSSSNSKTKVGKGSKPAEQSSWKFMDSQEKLCVFTSKGLVASDRVSTGVCVCVFFFSQAFLLL
jgi:hypothetical protein